MTTTHSTQQYQTATREGVVIAVLTYKRPEDIRRIVPLLVEQSESVNPPAAVLVVDNDPHGGAEQDVVEAAAGNPLVRYVHEPTPGIAAARNRALDESQDRRFLVFIDDDETPTEDWLTLLLETQRHHDAQAVVGRVVSDFEAPLTAWVEAGRFFDRRTLPTGTPVEVGATNNLLLDLEWTEQRGLRFDNFFGVTGGSDTLFTRQFTDAGGLMVWQDEAFVVDRVPAQRTTAKWVLQRAYRSGNGWSRVALYLRGPGAHVGLRAQLIVKGAVRVAGGALRTLVGTLRREQGTQAKGVRTVARGAGFVMGALGQHYSEYKRS